MHTHSDLVILIGVKLSVHVRYVSVMFFTFAICFSASRLRGEGKENWSIVDTTFLLEIVEANNEMQVAQRGRADNAAFAYNTAGITASSSTTALFQLQR